MQEKDASSMQNERYGCIVQNSRKNSAKEMIEIEREINMAEAKPLTEKSNSLTDTVINWYKRQIRADYAMHSLYDQLLRSATSVGANIAEAKFAQSNADYKSKMNIALKEASESRYWIQHLTTAGCIDNGLSNLLLELLNNIINILSSIVNK